MTPAAKPESALSTIGLSSFFIKNTQAAPSDVPMNGIRMPCRTCHVIDVSFPGNLPLLLRRISLCMFFEYTFARPLFPQKEAAVCHSSICSCPTCMIV